MPRGIFVTLEGGDGSGKSTLCSTLADMLRAEGHQVRRNPGARRHGPWQTHLGSLQAAERGDLPRSRTPLLRGRARPARRRGYPSGARIGRHRPL